MVNNQIRCKTTRRNKITACFALCCFLPPWFTSQFTNSSYVITDSGIEAGSTTFRTGFAILSSFAFFRKSRHINKTILYLIKYLQFGLIKLCLRFNLLVLHLIPVYPSAQDRQLPSILLHTSPSMQCLLQLK